MLKVRDFHLMKVYNVKGKCLGVIHDIYIDFYQRKILGFTVSSFSLFKAKKYIDIIDIISMTDIMVVSKLTVEKGLNFSNIKYMDIIEKDNVMLGVLEDILICKDDFSIKGLIVSSGIFDKMFKGKLVLLPYSCTLCESFILYNGNEDVKLKTTPHNLGGRNNDEKV